ncbi:hypothetical protein HYQ46_004058 [Verticillium longisporum]|nr:hypothetical protein HYQ46_004058 [Verticillium longisporum]
MDFSMRRRNSALHTPYSASAAVQFISVQTEKTFCCGQGHGTSSDEVVGNSASVLVRAIRSQSPQLSRRLLVVAFVARG